MVVPESPCSAMDGERSCGRMGIEEASAARLLRIAISLSVARHRISGHIWTREALRCGLGGKIEKVVSG